jgi:hypothetical protein
MKKHQQTLALLLVGTALASPGLPASADTESFTVAYGSASAPFAVNGDNFPINLTFPQFDASLGDLTDIQVTLTTTGFLLADVANTGAATTFTDAAATGTIAVSGPDGALSSVTLTTTAFGGSIASGTTALPAHSLGPQTSISGEGVSHVPLSAFPAYEAIGSGSSFNFPLNAVFNGSVSGQGASGVSFAGDASAYGSAEIDYSYVTNVPEPGQLLPLSVLCFGGWAMRNRLRRARASKPPTGPSSL